MYRTVIFCIVLALIVPVLLIPGAAAESVEYPVEWVNPDVMMLGWPDDYLDSDLTEALIDHFYLAGGGEGFFVCQSFLPEDTYQLYLMYQDDLELIELYTQDPFSVVWVPDPEQDSVFSCICSVFLNIRVNGEIWWSGDCELYLYGSPDLSLVFFDFLLDGQSLLGKDQNGLSGAFAPYDLILSQDLVSFEDFDLLSSVIQDQFSVKTAVNVAAVGAGSCAGLVFTWKGVRKLVQAVMTAFKSGRISL